MCTRLSGVMFLEKLARVELESLVVDNEGTRVPRSSRVLIVRGTFVPDTEVDTWVLKTGDCSAWRVRVGDGGRVGVGIIVCLRAFVCLGGGSYIISGYLWNRIPKRVRITFGNRSSGTRSSGRSRGCGAGTPRSASGTARRVLRPLFSWRSVTISCFDRHGLPKPD